MLLYRFRMKWMYGSNTTLGKRIAQLRQDRGWTQKELADKAEITQNHVSRIEKDRMKPRRATMKGLAEAFGIRVEDLEALAEVPDSNIEERLAKDDPDLAALISQIPLLSEEQKEALRVTLRSMIAHQKVLEVTRAAS